MQGGRQACASGKNGAGNDVERVGRGLCGPPEESVCIGHMDDVESRRNAYVASIAELQERVTARLGDADGMPDDSVFRRTNDEVKYSQG
jgi:hypothetical protein